MANTVKRKSFDSKRLRRLLKRRRIKQNDFTLSIDLNEQVFHRALVTGLIKPEQLLRIAKRLNVDPRYLKGENMLQYWNLEDPVERELFNETEKDEEGIPYGEYNDLLISESIQGSADEMIETSRLFEQWLLRDIGLAWLDEEDNRHDYEEYIRLKKSYQKFGIPYGVTHLMNAAVNGMKERMKEDYRILQLMENREKKGKNNE